MPVHARRPRPVEHALLVLDQAFVFEVAVAIDQHQAAASAGSLEPREYRRGIVHADFAPAPDPRPERAKSRSSGRNRQRVENSLGRAVGVTGRNRHRQVADAATQRRQHALHPLRIGLAQRPRRLLVNIGVAGEHSLHPGLDAHGERQRAERFGQFDRSRPALTVSHSALSTSVRPLIPGGEAAVAAWR